MVAACNAVPVFERAHAQQLQHLARYAVFVLKYEHLIHARFQRVFEEDVPVRRERGEQPLFLAGRLVLRLEVFAAHAFGVAFELGAVAQFVADLLQIALQLARSA